MFGSESSAKNLYKNSKHSFLVRFVIRLEFQGNCETYFMTNVVGMIVYCECITYMY